MGLDFYVQTKRQGFYVGEVIKHQFNAVKIFFLKLATNDWLNTQTFAIFERLFSLRLSLL